jgi:hypothetical protein
MSCALLGFPGFFAPSREPSAGGREGNKVQYFVVISGGISSDIGYRDVFVAQ